MKGYLTEVGAFVKIFYKTTVLGPTLILVTLLFLLLGIVLSVDTHVVIVGILLFLFICAVVTALYQIILFTHRDPDRLAWQHQILQRNLIERIYGDESHDMTRARIAVAIINPELPESPGDFIELPESAERQKGKPEEPTQLV